MIKFTDLDALVYIEDAKSAGKLAEHGEFQHAYDLLVSVGRRVSESKNDGGFTCSTKMYALMRKATQTVFALFPPGFVVEKLAIAIDSIRVMQATYKNDEADPLVKDLASLKSSYEELRDSLISNVPPIQSGAIH